MEHLQGLCEVLGLTIDEAAKGATKEARTDEEQAWLDAMRAVPAGVDREYLLGLAAQMASRPR